MKLIKYAGSHYKLISNNMTVMNCISCSLYKVSTLSDAKRTCRVEQQARYNKSMGVDNQDSIDMLTRCGIGNSYYSYVEMNDRKVLSYAR